jgi:hypothetical protein
MCGVTPPGLWPLNRLNVLEDLEILKVSVTSSVPGLD